MVELELEKTYLVKVLPADLEKYSSREILDIYIPSTEYHPVLRLRKKVGVNGASFEMTKKQPVDGADASAQTEHTIKLTKAEFEELAAIPGKRVRKIRYDYPYKGVNAEIALFQGGLAGLALVDVEFKDETALKSFGMPDFCLADVTNEELFAGGILCGKTYADIKKRLDELGYRAILTATDAGKN